MIREFLKLSKKFAQIVQFQQVHKLSMDHRRLERNEMKENLANQKYDRHEYAK